MLQVTYFLLLGFNLLEVSLLSVFSALLLLISVMFQELYGFLFLLHLAPQFQHMSVVLSFLISIGWRLHLVLVPQIITLHPPGFWIPPPVVVLYF